MIIYSDHLQTALYYAIREMTKQEAAQGYTHPSIMLAVLMEAQDAVDRKEHIEVHQR